MIVPVNSLDIDYKGNCNDGFPTHLVVNGEKLSNLGLVKYQKTIELVAEVMKPLRIVVEHKYGDVVDYCPQEFDMTLGELRVRLHPDRHPCEVSISGVELRCCSVRVLFAEGQAVSPVIEFLPRTVR